MLQEQVCTTDWTGLVRLVKQAGQEGITIRKFGDLLVASEHECHGAPSLEEQLGYLLGTGRLIRISDTFHGHLAPSKVIDQTVIERLCYGAMHIKIGDLQDGASQTNQSHPLSEYTLPELDGLFGSLLPFEDPNEAFFDVGCTLPLLDNKVRHRKGSLTPLYETIRLIHHHRLWLQKNQNLPKSALQVADLEFLSARMADREVAIGTVVRTQEGYFYVDRHIWGNGAFIIALKDVTGRLYPRLVCRGTAVGTRGTSWLASGYNDLAPELGVPGVQSVWPKVRSYLEQLRDEGYGAIELLGRSLGGAHAQYLTILIEAAFPRLQLEVHRLWTQCSVGVPKATHAHFAEVVAKRRTPLKVRVVRNAGIGEEADRVVLVGGPHLGFNISDPAHLDCQVWNVGSASLSDDISIPNRNLVADATGIVRSLKKAHMRQNAALPEGFTVIKVREEALENALQMGRKREKGRFWIAQVLNIFTLGWFRSSPFTALYQSALNWAGNKG